MIIQRTSSKGSNSISLLGSFELVRMKQGGCAQSIADQGNRTSWRFWTVLTDITVEGGEGQLIASVKEK